MFVCICNGVTETQIRDAVADGAVSLQDLHDELGVASQCGSCGDHALSLIHERFTPREGEAALFHAVA